MSRSMPTSQKVESSNVISELESADLDLVLQNPNGAHGRDKRGNLIRVAEIKCIQKLTV